jgi:hypothetical protein
VLQPLSDADPRPGKCGHRGRRPRGRATYFVELGLKVLGEGPVDGGWLDRVVGLEGVRVDIAMLETSDSHGWLELMKFRARRPGREQTRTRPPRLGVGENRQLRRRLGRSGGRRARRRGLLVAPSPSPDKATPSNGPRRDDVPATSLRLA